MGNVVCVFTIFLVIVMSFTIIVIVILKFKYSSVFCSYCNVFWQ